MMMPAEGRRSTADQMQYMHDRARIAEHVQDRSFNAPVM